MTLRTENPRTDDDTRTIPGDALLRRLSVPHRARAHLTAGPSDEWHLVWTLILALRRADLARIGCFDAGFTGYGAEDTDLAFRARDAGLTLRFSPAEAFHQHHGVMTPPLHHLEDILVNARRFRQVHGRWAMEGWLRAFADRHGLFVTGSSDYHGTGKPNPIGEHTTGAEVLAEIERQGTGTAIIRG